MIAKKEWFRPRILGWGLRPATWEGWVYVAIIALLTLAAFNLPVDEVVRVGIAAVVLGVFVIDSLVVMFQMYKKLDEREKKHQLFIESAASFTAVIAIILVGAYQILFTGTVEVGIWIVLGAMVIAKVAFAVYFWKNG